jgi:hypothetical protein
MQNMHNTQNSAKEYANKYANKYESNMQKYLFIPLHCWKNQLDLVQDLQRGQENAPNRVLQNQQIGVQLILIYLFEVILLTIIANIAY